MLLPVVLKRNRERRVKFKKLGRLSVFAIDAECITIALRIDIDDFFERETGDRVFRTNVDKALRGYHERSRIYGPQVIMAFTSAR